MRHAIDAYVQAIAHDNAELINENGQSVAEYIVSSAESTGNWTEFFDAEEYEDNDNFVPTEDQVDELRSYLTHNYNYYMVDTLYELAEVINNNKDDYNAFAVNNTIDRNGWNTDDDDTHICNDGYNVVEFNDNGEAVVRQYFN